MRDLDTIGRSNSTDQSSLLHNYLVRFEPLFAPLRDKPITLIEMGIGTGASIRTWHEYFPNAKIVGIDCDPGTANGLPVDRVETIIGFTTTESFWNNFDRRFTHRTAQIIIDDGDHHPEAQLFAFRQAFKWLALGGIYIIQDTHFERMESEREFFNYLVNDMNHGLPEQCGDNSKSGSLVASVEFSRSLIVIRLK